MEQINHPEKMPQIKLVWKMFGALFVLVIIISAIWLFQQKKISSNTETEAIAGIDADGNGIRDDVDSFITTRYGTNPIALKAAEISARARNHILTTDATNKSDALAALKESGDAGVCAGRGFRKAGLNSGNELNEIYLRTYNTPERLLQYKAVSGAAGQFEQDVTLVVCE